MYTGLYLPTNSTTNLEGYDIAASATFQNSYEDLTQPRKMSTTDVMKMIFESQALLDKTDEEADKSERATPRKQPEEEQALYQDIAVAIADEGAVSTSYVDITAENSTTAQSPAPSKKARTNPVSEEENLAKLIAEMEPALLQKILISHTKDHRVHMLSYISGRYPCSRFKLITYKSTKFRIDCCREQGEEKRTRIRKSQGVPRHARLEQRASGVYENWINRDIASHRSQGARSRTRLRLSCRDICQVTSPPPPATPQIQHGTIHSPHL